MHAEVKISERHIYCKDIETTAIELNQTSLKFKMKIWASTKTNKSVFLNLFAYIGLDFFL